MAGRRGGLDGRPWGTCGFRKPAADRGPARTRHARPYVGVRSAGVHPTRGCGAGGYEIRPYGPALGLFVGAEFISGQWLSGAIRFRQPLGPAYKTSRLRWKRGRGAIHTDGPVRPTPYSLLFCSKAVLASYSYSLLSEVF